MATSAMRAVPFGLAAQGKMEQERTLRYRGLHPARGPQSLDMEKRREGLWRRFRSSLPRLTTLNIPEPFKDGPEGGLR